MPTDWRERLEKKMSTKPTAFRLDAELLEEIDKFKDFINENTKFPPRSRTDVVHFLLRKGLEAAWTPQPPKPGCEISAVTASSTLEEILHAD